MIWSARVLETQTPDRPKKERCCTRYKVARYNQERRVFVPSENYLRKRSGSRSISRSSRRVAPSMVEREFRSVKWKVTGSWSTKIIASCLSTRRSVEVISLTQFKNLQMVLLATILSIVIGGLLMCEIMMNILDGRSRIVAMMDFCFINTSLMLSQRSHLGIRELILVVCVGLFSRSGVLAPR